MCYNCGCSLPQDDMGHPDNITDTSFSSLGKILGKTEKEAQELTYSYLMQISTSNEEKKAIEDMFEKASLAWGQSIEEAKKNTLDLLKDTLGK